MSSNTHPYNDNDIAIIGYACRVPGASSAETFWNMLCEGNEALVEIESNTSNQISNVMKFSGATEFDANFFGYSRFEAELLDPQQRLFLETCWHALEMSGYAPDATPGLFGLYAGCAFPTYLLDNIHIYSNALNHAQKFQFMLANDKDYLATRVAYKLNLLGQAVTVQTACSTSLVALHHACQALLNGELDGALAGGISLIFPQNTPYTYQEGMILSQDGHCRPFAENASGTIIGDGVGVVVIKRHADALRDHDTIYAMIKGTAINNDGNRKVSFIAPNVESQVAVISEALSAANVEPESISYIEAHGTGTKLGDPIEIAALKQVFATNKTASCSLGSVKANIGHLNTASGIIGAIKTVMILDKKQIPPQINCDHLNPACQLEQSFLQINKELKPWDSNTIRRAAVSSFGFGGTNAHAIFQEAIKSELPPLSWNKSFGLKISAKSEYSLKAIINSYQSYLIDLNDDQLVNFCFTANTGRSDMPYRLFFKAQNKEDLIAQLAAAEKMPSPIQDDIKVEFHFGETQSDLDKLNYQLQQEPFYKKLHQHYLQFFDANITYSQQLFASQFALAQYLNKMGIYPTSISGQGTGLLAAACISGHLDLEQAIKLLTMESKEVYLKQEHLPLVNYDNIEDLKEALLNPDKTMVSNALFTVNINSAIEKKCFTLNHDLSSLLGFCYAAGVAINWTNYYKGTPVYRMAIPVYAFDRKEYVLTKPTKIVKKESLNHLFEIQWQPTQVCSKPMQVETQHLFIIFVNKDELRSLQEQLISFNCIFIAHDPAFSSSTKLVYCRNFNQEDWMLLHDIYTANQNKEITLIHALSINPGNIMDVEQNLLAQQSMSYNTLLKIGQFLSQNEFKAKLWLLTNSLVASPSTTLNPLHGYLSGLASVMATELSKYWGGSIHFDNSNAYNLGKILSIIIQSTGQIDIYANQHCISQKKLVALPETLLTNYKPPSGTTYIIVGGTGGIGQLIIKQLSSAGASHFLLISPNKPQTTPAHTGVKIEHIQADISNLTKLSEVLKPIVQNKAIKGLIHAAGVLDDALLFNQTLESYLNVGAAKVQGSWNLHLLSQEFGWELDFFIMLSSISSLFGTIGQANYAAANAFQNHLSAYRQSLGLKSTSILLGGLDNIGMSKNESNANKDIFERVNIQKISSSFFMGALEHIYQLPQAVVVLQPMNFNTIKKCLLTPLQQSLISNTEVKENTNTTKFRQHLNSQTTAMQLEIIIQWLQETLAKKINSPIEQVPLNTGFNELGLDSLMAVDLKEEVDKALNISLPITSFFNNSTVVKLSRVIIELLIEKSSNEAIISQSKLLSLQPSQEITTLNEEELATLIAAEFEQL